jgi:hypothetical protein
MTEPPDIQRETDIIFNARISALELIVADLCKHLGRDAPPPSLGSEWLLVKQAAGKIGYSESGIRNLMRRKEVEFIKTKGGRTLIKAASLPAGKPEPDTATQNGPR